MILCILFVLMFSASCMSWRNDYDKNLDFTCKSGSLISRIRSVHSNRKEDRVWDFECSQAGYGFDSCYWTGYVNSWDRDLGKNDNIMFLLESLKTIFLEYKCDQGVITGLKSQHDNGKEDRQWQVRCCTASAKRFTYCILRI